MRSRACAPTASIYTVEILGEHESDAAAGALAQHYADLWQDAVNLYRVPFVHTGSAACRDDQTEFVRRYEPRSAD
jgi:hypothetical protein